MNAAPAHFPQAHPAAETPATTWLREVHSTDIDEHAAAQHDWSLRYEQLSAGRFSGLVHHVQLPGVRLVHEVASVATHQRGQLGRGHFGFAMALDLHGTAIFNGQRIDSCSIMVGSTDDLDLVTPRDFSMIALVVEEEVLQPLWQHMYLKPLSAWLRTQVVTQATPAAAAALRQLHLGAMARLKAGVPDARAATALRDSVLMEWIEALPPAVAAPDLKTVAARRRVVDRVCELMLAAGADEPPSFHGICRQVGASPRKVEYCFQDVLGTSPARYLRAVRLNHARRDMRAATDTHIKVLDVAAHWGFWHLGQFAQDYKRQFGELPSQTLRAARG